MKIKELSLLYLRHMHTMGRSPYTIKGAKSGLRDLERFLEEIAVYELEDLSPEALAEYQEDLAFRVTDKGGPLAPRTRAQMLGVVRAFTRFLKEQDYLVRDPAEKLRGPKKPKMLPRVILSLLEVSILLRAPNLKTRQGWRDRIVLEILYDTGIRRSEMAAVKATDLDLEAGYLHVRKGKGDKDRVVPISGRVCELTRNYILAVRPYLAQGKDEGWLILNRWGRKMDPNGIWAVVKRATRTAGINKNISTYSLRHSCATHMHKNGAPVRHLQEMLGHESLESTQIYTRVTINDLKKIHAKYHPRESMTMEENSPE